MNTLWLVKCSLLTLVILAGGTGLLLSVSGQFSQSEPQEQDPFASEKAEKLSNWTHTLMRARLVEAILNQDVEQVERLLAQGADPLEREKSWLGEGKWGYGPTLYRSPLLYAVGYAHNFELTVFDGKFHRYQYGVAGPFEPSANFDPEAAAEIAQLLVRYGANPEKESPILRRDFAHETQAWEIRKKRKGPRNLSAPPHTPLGYVENMIGDFGGKEMYRVLNVLKNTPRGEYREPEWALEVEKNLDQIKTLWAEYAD